MLWKEAMWGLVCQSSAAAPGMLSGHLEQDHFCCLLILEGNQHPPTLKDGKANLFLMCRRKAGRLGVRRGGKH